MIVYHRSGNFHVAIVSCKKLMLKNFQVLLHTVNISMCNNVSVFIFRVSSNIQTSFHNETFLIYGNIYFNSQIIYKN